ncbi:MAG: IclR family transcriptional regulator [Oscillospiraceae bacterium]
MSEADGNVQSVTRIFNIIEVLSTHSKGMTLQAIATKTSLAKSTAHRLLASLIAQGIVVQDSFSSAYRLTLKLYELSSRVVNDMDIISIARGHLDRLARHTGEAVHLVIPDGADIVYVYKAEAQSGNMRMSSHVGLRIPMYCTGVGKAILSCLPTAQVERIWKKSEIKKLTPHTITDLAVLQTQLDTILQTGYAIDDEENELGIRCVAVPLGSGDGRCEAAFSISGLAPQMDDTRISEIAVMALKTKLDILRDLGK